MNSLCNEFCALIPKTQWNEEIKFACDLVEQNKTSDNSMISNQLNQMLQCNSKTIPDCKTVCSNGLDIMATMDPKPLVDYFCSSKDMVKAEKKLNEKSVYHVVESHIAENLPIC